MKEIWRKIKFWFWWRFIAIEHEKVKYDLFTKGVAFFKSGKIRIDPNQFLPEFEKTYKKPDTDMVDALVYSFKSRP